MSLAVLLLAALAAAPRPPDELTVASSRGERRVTVRVERGYPAVAAPELGTVLSLVQEGASPGHAALRVAGGSFDFVLEAAYFRFDGRVYPMAAAPYLSADTLILPLQWVVVHLPRLMPDRFRYDARNARLDELPAPPVRTSSLAGAAPARPRSETPPPRRIVALDAGHGGLDHGMTGPLGEERFLREKDVTLAIARLVGQELQQRGFGVVMTRSSDTLIGRDDRGRIAARRGAHVFVSIHVNDADPRFRNAATARGFETYFLAEARTEDERRVAQMENAVIRFETTAGAQRGDPLSFILNDLAQNEHLRESSRLAVLVQESLGRVHPSESRGVKQAGFAVLATSYMPAILIETGFGSNPAEARYLVSESGQRRVARAIADGIERYLGEYERRVGQ